MSVRARTTLTCFAIVATIAGAACEHRGDVRASAGDAGSSVTALTEPSTTTPLPAPTTTATTQAPPTTTPPPTTPPTVRRATSSTTAPRTAAAPTPAAAPASKCHPSYEGTCIPPDVSDADCAGGGGNGPWYVKEKNIRVVGPDVFDLDRDGDGIGCDR